MTHNPESDTHSRNRLSPALIGTVMALIAIIAPIAISLIGSEWETSISVIAMTWQGYFSSWGSDIFFDPFSLIPSLPFTILRLVFVYMMVRLYQGKTTRNRTLLVGIASELQLAAIYYGMTLITMLVFPTGYFYFQIIIPIPILLFAGFLIVHLYPPGKTTMWIEEVESRSWWDTQQDEETDESKPNETKKKSPKEIDSPW